jgi:large subunit ribosomal protein L4
MPSVALRSTSGAETGAVDLPDTLFGVQPNVPVMHQVVTAQLAKRRAGTQSTKTRAEVSGGGKKPFKQKGTGNARQGSTRAPHWSGGGVALGPKPRSYEQRTPKKMIRLALASALSDRVAEGRVIVVDAWGWQSPSTKSASAALGALGAEGRTLVVVDRDDDVTIKSFRNLPEVQVILSSELNAYDVLCADWIVFSRDTVPPASAGVVRRSRDVAPGPYAGSVLPPADGSIPAGYAVKGNADSMLFHEPGSRYYKQTKAEFYFASAEAASAAGFSAPGSATQEDKA